MNIDSILPDEIRNASPTITRLTAGLSGAGVYRVETADRAFVLKISAEHTSLAEWQRTHQIQQLAANAGLAPPVIHIDEPRRAVLSALVVDRSFPAFYGDPRTHGAAITALGRMLRRLHDVPLPSGMAPRDPLAFLARLWSGPLADVTLPAFVPALVGQLQAEEAPASDHPLVLSHNDVNPGNLIYDGEHLLLLDWETAGPNDPCYDLAVISIFMRMDHDTCRQLLTVHEGAPVASLSARFRYLRRVAAILCGTAFLHLACQSGYQGASGQETLETTMSLVDFYQQLRTGAMRLGSAEGQWAFGLALMKASIVA